MVVKYTVRSYNYIEKRSWTNVVFKSLTILQYHHVKYFLMACIDRAQHCFSSSNIQNHDMSQECTGSRHNMHIHVAISGQCQLSAHVTSPKLGVPMQQSWLDSKSQVSCSLHLFFAGITAVLLCPPFFLQVLEIQNWILTFVWQILYWLGHLPSSYHLL